MNNSQFEVWLRMYEEQVRHARHHETLRTHSTNVIIIISAAILAFLSSKFESHSQHVVFGFFLIAINVYGLILSLKHYERNQLHLEVSRHYRTVLSQFSALEGRELNRERRAGRDKHYNKAGKIKDLRVHFLWSGLHGIIALMGAAVVLHEIVFRQQPSIP